MSDQTIEAGQGTGSPARLPAPLVGLIFAAATAFAQGGFEGPGRYEIVNLKSGKVMQLDRIDQTSVIQYSSRGTDHQRWDIEPAGEGLFFIRNAMNGKALEAPQNSNSTRLICRRFDRGPNQHWQLRPGEGNLLIVSRDGRAIDVPNGASRDGLGWQIYNLNGDSNQQFIVRRVGGLSATRQDDHDRRPPETTDRNREPDPTGRFWDDREQMWKLAGDGVCFYRQTDFRGEALCSQSANEITEVSRDDSFGSVKLFGGAQGVEIFDRPGFRGERFRITRDVRDLERTRNRVASFRVNE
jgi:hypothetical protein